MQALGDRKVSVAASTGVHQRNTRNNHLSYAPYLNAAHLRDGFKLSRRQA
ncbi:MAG: hypothetical protein ACI8PB_005388, partial [Desulforhopalus sp.]